MYIGKLTVIITSNCVEDMQFRGVTFMVCRASDIDDLPGGEEWSRLCVGPVDTTSDRKYQSSVCRGVETSSCRTRTEQERRREDRRDLDKGQVWGTTSLLTTLRTCSFPYQGPAWSTKKAARCCATATHDRDEPNPD